MVEIDRLIWIVTGVQLNAELGDRPLAYRIEREIKNRLEDLLGETPEGELPPLAPAVISDVYYLNSEQARERSSHDQHRRPRRERALGRAGQHPSHRRCD